MLINCDYERDTQMAEEEEEDEEGEEVDIFGMSLVI